MGETTSTQDRQKRIYLERFNHENAELILAWRNAAQVRKNSLNNEAIDRNDHLRFVEQLNSRPDQNYFIVHVGDSPLGVLNVNVSESTGYWGCYLAGSGSEHMRPGHFPLLVGLAGAIAFQIFDCYELNSDVVKHNVAPQKMNAFLKIPIVSRRVVERQSNSHVEVLCYSLERRVWPQVLTKLLSTLTTSHRELLKSFVQAPSI